MEFSSTSGTAQQALRIPTGAATLDADLTLPPGASGLVLFAHGSGSSRFSTRNRHVARFLNDGGLATVLADLLTPGEEAVDERTRHLRFDIGMLADRLVAVTDWLGAQERTADLPIGHFGASTGAGAALVAAASRPDAIRAVVSRGGRPDLAGDALPRVHAPTLLIVGSRDLPVIAMNQQALARLGGEKDLVIVPGATHLFEEAGTLDEVARLARDWFVRHLADQAASQAVRRAPRAARQDDLADAEPGRQYQGTGVMNKAGRFGSSRQPQDLGGTGGFNRDEGGRHP